jgi:hypothetical protein
VNVDQLNEVVIGTMMQEMTISTDELKKDEKMFYLKSLIQRSIFHGCEVLKTIWTQFSVSRECL